MNAVGLETLHRKDRSFPVELCCPACHQHMIWTDKAGRCSHCGGAATLRGNRIPDFVGQDGSVGEAILEWPTGLFSEAEHWLPASPRDRAGSPEKLKTLQAKGLIDDRGQLTALGRHLSYHLGEYHHQKKDERTRQFLNKGSFDDNSKVLDIGCGAGQTLRLLGPYQPAQRIGLDVDFKALALGCRLADAGRQDIQFVRATGESLPFPEGQFTHVLGRVALNYMHQQRALNEMVRVLQPGGILLSRVEGPGFDCRLLAQAGSLREFGSRLYDFLLGGILAATAWQPTPGSRFGGGRTFATIRGLTHTLNGAGCDVIAAEPVAYRAGLATGIELTAKRVL